MLCLCCACTGNSAVLITLALMQYYSRALNLPFLCDYWSAGLACCCLMSRTAGAICFYWYDLSKSCVIVVFTLDSLAVRAQLHILHVFPGSGAGALCVQRVDMDRCGLCVARLVVRSFSSFLLREPSHVACSFALLCADAGAELRWLIVLLRSALPQALSTRHGCSALLRVSSARTFASTQPFSVCARLC